MTTQPTVQVDVKQLVKEITGTLSKQLKSLEDGSPAMSQTILTQTAIITLLAEYSLAQLTEEELDEVDRLKELVGQVELDPEDVEL